jgi:hypothetical protein
MTQILPRPATSLARPANLLLLALLPLVAFMALAHVTVVGGSAVEMTAAQVDERALQWMAVAVLWTLPSAFAAVAFTAIAPGSRAVRLLAGLGIALLIAYVVAQAGLVWIDKAETLAESSWLPLAILLSLLGWWAIDVAAVLTCLGLYRSNVAPKAALVIGILTVLFLVLEVAVYLPALIGSQELNATVGLPPMVLPVLWAILGGVLKRRGNQLPAR